MRSLVVLAACVFALIAVSHAYNRVKICEVSTYGRVQEQNGSYSVREMRTVTYDCAADRDFEKYAVVQNCHDGDVLCGIVPEDSFETAKSWEEAGVVNGIYKDIVNTNLMSVPEGTKCLVVGNDEDNNQFNVLVFNNITKVSDDLFQATHLSFQFAVLRDGAPTHLYTKPTLFVSMGSTTIASIEVSDPKFYDMLIWHPVNIPLKGLQLSQLRENWTTIGFRFVHNESISIGIDTVRFVKFANNDNNITEYTYAKSGSECAPGCKSSSGYVYDPQCDNVACLFEETWIENKNLERKKKANLCYNQLPSNRVVHHGKCYHMYPNNSCCTSIFDEEVSYSRDKGELSKACDLQKASAHCRDLLDALLCAHCHPSSSVFTGSKGSVLICAAFAREIYDHCSPYCPTMENLNKTAFFLGVNLGLVVDNTHDCFNGLDTPGSYLLPWQIALIAGVPGLLIVFACVFLVILGVKSKKFAETIDDKEETNTCVVAPESAAAASVAPPVEMDSVQSQSVQSVQPANSTMMSVQSNDGMAMPSADQQAMMMSMQQMQMQQMQMQQMQMMMMMNSGAMASQNMMLNSQANASSPELNATVAPKQ